MVRVYILAISLSGLGPERGQGTVNPYPGLGLVYLHFRVVLSLGIQFLSIVGY